MWSLKNPDEDVEVPITAEAVASAEEKVRKPIVAVPWLDWEMLHM